MARPAPDPDAGRRQPLRYLAAAFTTQMLAAGGFIFFALIVPELARETGLPERDFGLAVTFIFIGTALSSPLTGLYTRLFGSVGAQALALAWMSGALLLILFGTWWMTMLAAVLFGMGYGPLSPLGMTIVTERTPRSNRGLFLSIRQSSQPFAGVILGRLLPPFVLAYGWQAGVLSISASVAIGVAVVAFSGRVSSASGTRPPSSNAQAPAPPRRSALQPFSRASPFPRNCARCGSPA